MQSYAVGNKFLCRRADLANCEIEDKNPAVNRLSEQNGIKRGMGLRQGMPLSPIFSNVILRDFDNEMIRLGKRLVRYADDFIVMAESREECLEIDRIARDLLGRKGFTLPELGDGKSKTYIAEPNQEIEFLGLALSPKKNASGYELIITEKQFDKIKRSFGDMKNVSDLVKDGVDITMLTKKIENKISGYLAAYAGAQNNAELSKIVEKYRSEILWSIFSRLFGEQSVQKLTREQKKFLCLAG